MHGTVLCGVYVCMAQCVCVGYSYVCMAQCCVGYVCMACTVCMCAFIVMSVCMHVCMVNPYKDCHEHHNFVESTKFVMTRYYEAI